MSDELVGKQFDFYGVDNHAFKLDATAYEAVEDESDGYRSYLGSVEVKNAEGLVFFQTPLDRVTVEARDGEFQGFVLVGSGGHEWLKYGTNNSDDYYPWFVFDYEPKAEVNHAE